MSTGRLPYDIVFCTSEDSKHPVTDLTGYEADPSEDETTNGWQSEARGKVPQTLVLRFHGNAWLQQIRILCHESKIATKVEVRVFQLTDTMLESPVSYRSARFTKLGAVEFNSNEHSDYKSKERKTVHLQTEAYFVKLLFSRPYPNHLNTKEQVGIYSIECIGRITGQARAYADECIAGYGWRHRHLDASLNDDGTAHLSGSPSLGGGDGGSERMPLSSQQSVILYPRDGSEGVMPSFDIASFRSVRIVEFEDFFIRRSEELLLLKDQALAVSDVHTADECREKLRQMNRLSRDIYELEQRKVQAIIEEDFETADDCKTSMNTLIEKLFIEVQLPDAGIQRAHEDNTALVNGGLEKPFATELTPPRENSRDASRSASATAVQEQEERPSSGPPIAAREERDITVDELPAEQKKIAAAILSAAGENADGAVPETSVTGIDITPLQSAVGSFTTACLFSKKFKLRESSLVVLSDCIGSGGDDDSVRFADAVLRFLDYPNYGLQDNMPSVVAVAFFFVQKVVANRTLASNVSTPLLHLLPRIVSRCTEPNQRIRDEALATMAACVKDAPASLTGNILNLCVLADPVDKDKRNLPTGNPRAQLVRLNILQMLQDNRKLSLDGGATTKLINKVLIPSINHQNAEVRDLCATVLSRLVSEETLTLKEKDLRKINNSAIRENIQASAKRKSAV